jgi:hypothetical protein
VCARDREVAAQQKNLGGRSEEGGGRRQKGGRSDGVHAGSRMRTRKVDFLQEEISSGTDCSLAHGRLPALDQQRNQREVVAFSNIPFLPNSAPHAVRIR